MEVNIFCHKGPPTITTRRLESEDPDTQIHFPFVLKLGHEQNRISMYFRSYDDLERFYIDLRNKVATMEREVGET